MAEFDDIRKNLETARREASAASRALFAERQRLRRLERQRRAAERVADADALGKLDETIAGQKAAVAGQAEALARLRGVERERLGAFLDFTDPREHIGRLSDATPILLMPLRIETRFKLAEDSDGQSELWVRVFPDDIAVDVFEDTLSESELRQVRSYWTDLWRSGGVEADDRTAWHVFAGQQGAGRAYWIRETYRPTNEAERPTKAEGVPTVILAITTEVPLVDPERAAVWIFWEAHWRAEGNPAGQTAALQALAAVAGDQRAAELVASYVPANLSDAPPEGASRETVTIIVAFVEFRPAADDPIRESGWTTAPHVEVMPDRLVLLGFRNGQKALELLGNPIPSPLVVAPDPSASEQDQIQPQGEDLFLGSELEWIADFDKAIQIGMGFRVPLPAAEFRHGFDELMVLGVRLRADAADGQAALEDLIDHHHRSRGGFEIVPQGRPTNNVEDCGSGYSWREDPDVSFDRYFGDAPQADPSGWYEKRDGRWLAETLGLAPERLAEIAHYGGTDISDARTMNVALWPATLGYFMETMLHPVFEDDTVEFTREFFVRHVSARGMIPAIRVRKQPYGILPATPRSRMDWLAAKRGPTGSTAVRFDPGSRFLLRLYGLLRKVDADWSGLLDKVSRIGKPGADPHQVLLDVMGLHSGSVEFQQRYAESFQQWYNRMRLEGAGGALVAVLVGLGYVASGLQLLGELGYEPSEGAEAPDILEKLFLHDPALLKGPLIDDRPLSETDPIRSYTEAGESYIAWLKKAAETSHDALRLQKGFSDGRPPTALLYLMLHHALDLSFVETSLKLFFNAGLIDAGELRARRREATFIHLRETDIAAPAQTAGASRWELLYRTEPTVTGTTTATVGAFIPTVIKSMVATDYLGRQIDALEHLEGRPTAALERAFAEHIDLCSYRLDAWYGGLMSQQLARMRYGTAAGGDGPARQGIYLGAFGWLENVRPEFKRLTPVELPPDLVETFARDGDPPLMRDSSNAGFIHAPSLNHAVTAAVLRNGYLSNATPENPGSLAVNLSSERVRLALGIIQGMRSGQSLGALLGYQFERGLHDRHAVELDSYIYDLRKAFPLAGDRLAPTRTGRIDDLGRRLTIRKVEARNVIDGLALVEHMRKTGQRSYPFGLANELPSAPAADRDAISAEADRIANIADAVADLAIAESVHQVVQGNYDRAGATLDTYSKGKLPEEPDVIRTPRSGVTLLHRVGLHLEPGIAPADPGNTTPRARCEPAVNRWLGQVLPPPATVACLVTVSDPLDATETTHAVSQADLGLAPIDMIHVVSADDEQAMNALDDLVTAHVVATHAPRPHTTVSISYRAAIPAIAGHVTFFEVAALIRSLQALILRSRPLRASDLALAQEAERPGDADVTLDPARITLNRDTLAGHVATLITFEAALAQRIANDENDQIITKIDISIAAFLGVVRDLTPFGRATAGLGEILDDRRRIFREMLDILAAYTDRWDGLLAEFDAAIVAYNGLPAGLFDDEKFLALQKAERLIATAPTDPLPATPDGFRDDLVNVKRAAFEGQLNALKALHVGSSTLSGLHDDIVATLAANAAFDPEAIDLEVSEKKLLALAGDMATRAAALIGAFTDCFAAIATQISAHDTASDPKDRIEALTAAAKLLFGEDFQIVPEFGLPAPQADEWSAAWGPAPTADGAILDFLENDLGRPFPVEDWLYGIGRVREKMRHLENTVVLSEAMAAADVALQPLQFPHRPEVPWLALDFPETTPGGEPFVIDEDRLLYTGHYAVPFSKGARQCGLLIDEWTEVIPSRTEDTGLAAHYDRPNCEPPQTLLLALPSDFTGSWRWADVVDTVRETMDLAKKRAVEPDHIDTTAYARFLPATVSAVTLHPITAALNFAFNNNLATVLANGGGGNE